MGARRRKVRVSTLLDKKKAGETICAITAHDALSARIVR